MKDTLPTAPRPPLHLLVYAFGALFVVFAGVTDPFLAWGMTMATVGILSKV